MKFFLLLLYFIPLASFSQSEYFYRENDYPLCTNQSKHNVFPNGDKISVFASNLSGSDLISIIKKNALNGEYSQTDFLIEEFDGSILYGVVTYSDNSYLIAMKHEGTNISQILLKFSADDNLIWKERIFIPLTTYSYYSNEILNNGLGGAFIMISEGDFSGILNLDVNGQVIWAKTVVGQNSSGKSPGFSICKNSFGGINGTLKNESYQCVFSLNSNGTEIWSKSHIDMQYRWPKRIIHTNDGGYLVGGTFYDFFENFHKPYLTKYSSNGTLLFAKQINLLTFELWDIQEDSDGKLYALTGDYSNNLLVKMDGSGNVLDAHISTSVIGSEYSKFINQTNNLVFNGTINNEFAFGQILMDFDGNLNNLCSYDVVPNISTSNDDQFIDALVNTGVNINNLITQVLNDFTVSFPASSTISKEDFCDYLGTEEIIEKEQVSIYPNPTTNEISINLFKLSFNEISLHDLNGKMIKSICLNCSGVITEEFKSLEKGVYFVYFKNKNETITEKIIIN